jgi:hypothetical protein
LPFVAVLGGALKVRTILGVILITAATISMASAQSFSMDHGHAADAAKAARAASAAAADKAAASGAGKAGTTRQATDFSVNGSGAIRAAPPRTPEEQKADAAAQAAWQARCRPTVVEDREGMRRTKYAESNCDLSRFNTAGVQ